MPAAIEQQRQELFCAERVRLGGEPIMGTATGVRLWLLLEYRRSWQAKATTDNDLPAAVQAHLAQQLAALPDSRLLFIKQGKLSKGGLRFFVVTTGETTPAVFEMRLAAYRELLELDLLQLIHLEDWKQEHRRSDPLLLVCTNGRRDKCCARFGLPMYEALRDRQGENVWQASHLGGHRYSPNLLFLPQSVNYGLMTLEEGGPAVDALFRGEIFDLARYRGRTYYPAHVQAADYFLRRELGFLRLSGLQLVADEELQEDNWVVAFRINDGPVQRIHLCREMTAEARLVSCNTPKFKPLPRFKLLKIEL